MQNAHKPHSWLPAALLSLCVAAGVAQAGTITARFGSQDGFGIGLNSGDSFQFTDLVSPTAEGTDDWAYGGFSAQLNSSWTGNLVGAQMQIFSGGWGLDGDASVYLNNTLIGMLSNGDNGAGDYNHAWLDTFDLHPFLGVLTGADQVEIRTANPDDGGVLGFVKLLLQTRDAGGNTVPEPGSIALAGVALAGALLTRRRRKT